MKLPSAKVTAKWDDGHETEIGTIEIGSAMKGTEAWTRIRFLRQRFGWNLVLMGLAIMLPGRKWTEGNERD